MLQDLKELDSLIGKICWGNWWDNQAGTGLNFGEPRLVLWENKERTERKVWTEGECNLHLTLCSWKIENVGEKSVLLSSPKKKINIALRRLEGQKITKIEFDNTNGKTIFNFDLGSKLTCRRFDSDPESTLWSFISENPYQIIMAMGNGQIRISPRDQKTPKM